MESSPWQRIEQIFEQAATLPAEERAFFLNDACDGDADLRREVESLLAADHDAGTFLHAPALEGQAMAMPNPTPWLAPDQELGPYRIVRPLGRGGMAAVYLASREQDYQQEVALKVFGHGLHRRDLMRRFQHERQILAKLEHPCIARLLDGGTTDDGLPYLVMEYVEGEPIDAYCDRRGLSVPERIDLFCQLCDAVHYAHQHLVVHRDIKPNNILVTPDGTLKLLDFGIAKLLQSAGGVEAGSEAATAFLTQTGQRLMTPAYASPEQVRGEPMTTATDIYSLGVLLYRLLTGKLPYEVSDRLTDLERAILEDTPRRPSQTVDAGLRRQLSGDLDHILMQSLRKEATERYGSAEQLAEDLKRHQQGLPVLARGETLGYVARRLVRRHRLAVTVVGVFLLTVLGFTAYVTDLARRVGIERDEARIERDKAQQVASFLEDIFEVPAPDQARGETITAVEILDRGAAKLNQELKDQPQVYATLAATIAKVYTELGDYEAAEQMLEHAIASSQDALEGRPELANLLHRQGALGLSTGQVQEAETVLHQAAEMRRSQGGLELADSLDQLGVAHGMQGQFEEALPFFEESLAIRRQQLGPRALEVASSLNHLANLHRMRSDLPTAQAHFEKALEMMQEVDPDHSTVADLHQNLGMVHHDVGDFPKAADHFRTAIELKQDVYGEHHPSVLYSMANLGSALLRLGQDNEAEDYFQRAISKMEEAEVDLRLIGYNLFQWSDLDRNRGEFESAEGKIRRATKILLAEFGEDNPHHASCLYKLAQVRGAAGRLKEAEDLHRQALDMRRKTFGDEGFIIASSHLELGHVLTAAGQLDEAERHLRRGVELLTGTHGPESWRTLNAEAELAMCLMEQGRFDEAEPLLEKAWTWTESHWGTSHRKVQELRQALDRLASMKAGIAT